MKSTKTTETLKYVILADCLGTLNDINQKERKSGVNKIIFLFPPLQATDKRRFKAKLNPVTTHQNITSSLKTSSSSRLYKNSYETQVVFENENIPKNKPV